MTWLDTLKPVPARSFHSLLPHHRRWSGLPRCLRPWSRWRAACHVRSISGRPRGPSQAGRGWSTTASPRPVFSPGTVCLPMPDTPAAHGLCRPNVLRSSASSRLCDLCRVVPDDFRFVVKAHAWCTQPTRRDPSHAPGRSHTPNEYFLHPGYATEHVVEPCLSGLGPKPALSCFNSHPLMCGPLVDHSTLPHVYTLFSRPCRVGRCTRSSCAITSSYLRPIARC